MTDNPRTALYGAKYKAYIINKMDIEDRETVSIAGRCCESGTCLSRIFHCLPRSGDILAILDAGAYNYSMSESTMVSQLNGSFEGKQSEIIVKGETYEDNRNDKPAGCYRRAY